MAAIGQQFEDDIPAGIPNDVPENALLGRCNADDCIYEPDIPLDSRRLDPLFYNTLFPFCGCQSGRGETGTAPKHVYHFNCLRSTVAPHVRSTLCPGFAEKNVALIKFYGPYQNTYQRVKGYLSQDTWATLEILGLLKNALMLYSIPMVYERKYWDYWLPALQKAGTVAGIIVGLGFKVYGYFDFRAKRIEFKVGNRFRFRRWLRVIGRN